MPSGVYVRTPEIRRKLSLARTGQRLSEETRQKLSVAQKGKIRKISEGRWGEDWELMRLWKKNNDAKKPWLNLGEMK